MWARMLSSYMALLFRLDFKVCVTRIRSESEKPMPMFPLQLRFNPSKVTWRRTLCVESVRACLTDVNLL